MSSPTVERWFYRCPDCLSVVASAERIPCGWGDVGAKCGACTGKLEEMGQVNDKGSRLVSREFRCPCDTRCTHAKGPDCDCKCGGANHGSGMVVQVVRDRGPVPVLDVPQGLFIDSSPVEIAREFRAAIEPLRLEQHELNEAKRRDGWLSAGDFERLCNLSRVITRARSLRTHAARMRTLGSITPSKASRRTP